MARPNLPGARQRTGWVWLVHGVLAALAAAALVVWGPGTDPARQDQRVTTPDVNPRLPEPADTLSIVRPDGTLVLDTTTKESGARLADVMPAKEADYLTDAGAVRAKALVARDDEFTRGVWQIAVADSADPAEALRVADELYALGGWKQAPTEDEGLLVRVQEPTADQPLAAYRAHYVYGPFLIRIEAYGPDASRVDREFAELSARQLAEWPVDGVAR